MVVPVQTLILVIIATVLQDGWVIFVLFLNPAFSKRPLSSLPLLGVIPLVELDQVLALLNAGMVTLEKLNLQAVRLKDKNSLYQASVKSLAISMNSMVLLSPLSVFQTPFLKALSVTWHAKLTTKGVQTWQVVNLLVLLLP
eukprot:Lithocolla_globosa_v1_NODE_404_length_4145_cov_4.569927.p2 type:complete len:141 gc:universal NODE_404_length_4145_cov_4.569927:3452-3030(-)